MQHKDMAEGRWNKMSFVEQMANVASEVERTITWRNKENAEYSAKAFDRALELLDLTIADQKNKKYLKELLRTREALADYFVFDNVYKTSSSTWQKYFGAFSYAAALQRGV